MARLINILIFLLLTSPVLASQEIFKINYLGFIPFGKAILNIDSTHTELTLHPSKPVLWISKLQAKFSAQRNNHITIYTEDIENRMGSTDHKTIVYDHKNKIIEHIRGEFNGVRRKMSQDILDPLSFFSKLREIHFKKEKEYEFILNSNQSNYVLKCFVEKEEIIKDKNTWKIHSTMKREDKLDKRPKLTVDFWITKELPTLILAKANTLIGPVTISLED